PLLSDCKCKTISKHETNKILNNFLIVDKIKDKYITTNRLHDYQSFPHHHNNDDRAGLYWLFRHINRDKNGKNRLKPSTKFYLMSKNYRLPHHFFLFRQPTCHRIGKITLKIHIIALRRSWKSVNKLPF